jgi:hypothetical protein
LAAYSKVHTAGTIRTALSAMGLVEEKSLSQFSEPKIK